MNEEAARKRPLYLITGAAGHVGSALIVRLLERGERVRALVLPDDPFEAEPGVEIFHGDVCEPESLEPFFTNAEGLPLVVIHAAGIVSIASGYREAVYRVNVLGTKNVVAKCETHGVQKLIYISSVHAIPEKPPGEVMRETEEFNPEDVVGLYAKTKSEATREVLSAAKRGLNASVVHPSGIIGPYDPGHNHLTALIVDYVKGHLLCTVRGGYDFVDVRDVAEGILSCCEKGKPGECYILSNRFFSVQELFAMLQHVTGRRPIRFVMPQKLIETIAPLAELYYKILHRPPLFTAYSLYTLGSNALFSHEKADRELGYTARDINQTLADTVAWLRAQGYIK